MRRSKLFFYAVLLGALLTADVSAQSTEFTYQGRLLFGEVAANGSHDFEFVLWDAATGGVQLGPTVSLGAVNVNNGVFSVRVDFGDQFPGANRFLEIRVRQSGSGLPFNSLNPRQAISSAPYAIKSLNAENASNAESASNAERLGGVLSGQFVVTTDPRMNDARPPLPSSLHYVQNSTAQQASSNFNVSGVGTAGILNATTRFDIGGQRVLGVSGNRNLFVGVDAGSANLNGLANSFVGRAAGASNTTGNNNSFFGEAAGYSNTQGFSNSFFGHQAGQSNLIGTSNSVFGSTAGYNLNGSDNSFFGTTSGAGTTTGSLNSFFGINSGTTNVTGHSNTIIGSNANVGVSNLSNASAIGARALVTQSNSLILGSINGVNGASVDTRVGIGTTAPTAKLTVEGRGAYNTTNAARFDLYNTSANLGFLQHVTDIGSWQLATTTGTTRMVVDSLGNVGIGTVAPTARFNVVGASSSVATPIASITSTGSQTPLAFTSSGSEVARIRADSSGNLVFATVGGASKDIYFRAGDDASTPRIFINGADGKVGIGTTDPLSQLSVVGSVSISNQLSIGNLDSGGTLQLCRSSVNLIASCSSSIRYKTNVNTLQPGIELIRKLRPVTFNWISNDAPDIGFIAEEVAEVEPRLAFKNDSGLIEGVKYDAVGVVLVNAVNEQQTEIETQRKLIDEQRERILKLEAQVDQLTRLLCSQNAAASVCSPKK